MRTEVQVFHGKVPSVSFCLCKKRSGKKWRVSRALFWHFGCVSGFFWGSCSCKQLECPLRNTRKIGSCLFGRSLGFWVKCIVENQSWAPGRDSASSLTVFLCNPLSVFSCSSGRCRWRKALLCLYLKGGCFQRREELGEEEEEVFWVCPLF